MDVISNVETITKGSPNITELWLFIVCCVVVIIVVLFFLFYFNRVAARLVTLIANQYLWRRYGAYIQLDSIRVTLLGARILFKNFRYHSTNQSITIVKGHITIQYWLFNVQKPNSGIKEDTKLPCRVVCSVEGLEWFIYNNIPAYERMKIILGLETESPITTEDPPTPADDTISMDGTRKVLDPESQTMAESSLLLRLMPIQIECTTGAIIIGNQRLKTYIVVKATQTSGTYSAGQSRTSMDYYKSSLDLVLRKPQISLEKNENYKSDSQHMNSSQRLHRTYGWWKHIWRWIQWMFWIDTIDNPKKKQKQHEDQSTRRGSEDRYSRRLYQDDYAKIENIMECSQMAICYYADIPGPVPNTVSNGYSGIGLDIGNGGLPPEWGVHLSIWNALFNYGPWTDMQRASIQDYFFPNSHRTNKPTTVLSPGDTRIPTSFDFMVDFMTDGNLRIPTREMSKDWKYNGDMPDLDIDQNGLYTRPHGWFDIKFKEGSRIKTITPFVTNNDGYVSTVDIDLKGIDVTTSVNFAGFIHADNFKMFVDMPSPLVWNEHRTWTLDTKIKNPDIYLLRDHVYLVQDLIKDWTSGPPADLLHFIPITYDFQLDATQLSVYLCVNEHNIINYPNSTDDNAFIILSSQKVHFSTSLPFVTFQPEVISMKYDVQLEQIRGGISLQSSHTWSSFMSKEDSQVASVMSLSLQGSYESYSTIDVLRHIESSNLHLKFHGAVVKLFGTVIRYLFILRDNYVGNSLHFCTIDEYRQRRANPEEYLELRKKESEAKPMSDPFELYLLCEIEDGALILPENLYECSHYSQLEFQELQVELRNLDIYMDMYVTISPITWTRDSNPNPTTRRGHFKMKNARDPRNYLYIDETNIHAHRLFGPLPETSTYLCHWEFDIGSIKGELKPSFLMGAASFSQTFVYNLIDEDNAVSPDMASEDVPDVTFVKARIRQVDIYLMTQNSATLLQLENGIKAEFDNLTNEKYNQRIGVQLPGISLTCLANQDQASQQQDTEFSWVEVARIEVGLNVTIFRHTKEWKKFRTAQQNYIQTQDYLTGRCTHLYDSDSSSRRTHSSTRTTHEHHVGVLYAPHYRSFYLHEDSGLESEDSSMSTETPMDRRYSLSGDDDHSMISFNDQWPITLDALESEEDSISLHDDTTSMKSMVSNNDSFHTAQSEDELYPVTSMSSNAITVDYPRSFDEGSIESISEDESQGNGAYDEMDGENNFENFGYTITAIPPSISYSGYLSRYAVKRATNQIGRAQAFFHPYVPPPKTIFTPLKPKAGKQYEEEFASHEQDFFANAQEDTDTPSSPEKEHKDGEDDRRNDVVATTVLEATHPVKILVTPILVKVVQEVTEIINKDDWDLETMLDTSQIEYVGQLTRYLTDKFICTRFAVWLPSTHLHFIQNVMIPADLPSYKNAQSHLQTLYDNEDELLCAADIFLDDFRMIGGVTFQDYAFDQKQKSVAESKLVLEESRVHVNVGNMGCKVQYVSDHYENRRQVMFGIPLSRQHIPGRNFTSNDNVFNSDSESDASENQHANELVVIDLGLEQFCCKWVGSRKPNYLDFSVDKLSSIIITESAEILVGAVYSWLVFVDDLQRILECFQDRRTRQNQVFTHELAQFSNVGTAVTSDPQFLTIPTSMGLRIGSKNFRNDVGWKLLARMRQCLRLMPSTMREKLQYRLTSGGATEHVDSSLMYGQVIQAFSGWRSWEIDSRDIRSCRLFIKIFNQQASIQSFNNNNSKNNSNNGSDDVPSDDDEVVNSRGTSIMNDNHLDETVNNRVDEIVNFLMTSMNYAKFKINRFDFCIYEEEPDVYDNHILIEPLEFAIDTTYKTSMLENTAKGSPPPTITTFEGYLDIIGKLDIGLVEVSVNPTVMAFARHMLTVQRVFTAKLKSLSHATRSSSFFGRGKPTAYGPSNTVTNLTQVSPKQQRQQQQPTPLDFQLLLSRIDVMAHALVRIQEIKLGAWAQKLTMKNNICGIQGSLVFSNPRLSPVAMFQPSSEKDSDTGSGKPSSNKTSRKQGNTNSNRIIMDASGGIDVFDIGFYELLPRGSHWSNSKTGSSSIRHTSSKRIHTKLLAMTVHDAKLNANISQPGKINKKQKTTMDSNTRKILKIFSSVGSFDVDAPQSLLRLYSFVEEWRSEQGKRYHFMFQNLLTEWEEQRRLTDQTNVLVASPIVENEDVVDDHPERWYDIKLQFLLTKFVAKADLLRSLSIKYSIDDLLVLVNETQKSSATPVINYAFQLSKQVVELITHSGNNMVDNDIQEQQRQQQDITLLESNNANAFNLPGIRSSGILMKVMNSSVGKLGFQLQSSISIDFIAMSLDVSMIDSILTAHNLLGNEVNELVEVFSYSKKGRLQSTTISSSTDVSVPFKYAIGISLDGLSIKAASPSATGLFESNVLEASISNYAQQTTSQALIWKISGSNFALSLDHGSVDDMSATQQQQGDDRHDTKRRNRLAYIVVDFGLQNQPINEPGPNSTSSLDANVPSSTTNDNNNEQQHVTMSYYIKISKVQTVMQPIALGKLAEMYIYYDSELKKKKEIKQAEIEQLAANTKRIVESFQTDVPLEAQDMHTMWQGKNLTLIIEKFGVAIPLSDMAEGISLSTTTSTTAASQAATSPTTPVSISMEKSSGQQQHHHHHHYHHHHHHHAALLFSLTSLQFSTENIKTTTATIQDISLQFVKRFDQSNEQHFLAANHPRMNQMRLPSINCIVDTTFEKSTRKLGVQINANVRGFEVDLDGTITEYINRLGVIYVKSMDRVNAFTLETSETPVNSNTTKKSSTAEAISELIYLDVTGVFEYDASIVRLFPKRRTSDQGRRGKQLQRSMKGSGNDTRDITESSNTATIKLPGVNASFKYQTPLGVSSSLSNSPRRLHGDILILESNNVLHPSLVQFLHEVTSELKLGMQQSSERKATTRKESSTSSVNGKNNNNNNINASLLLRLSKTKLDLSCQPASKVVCSLGWSESEFMMNSFAHESGHTMSCFGSLRSISAVVKHHFSPQSCLTANIERILFNASLTSKRQDSTINDDISIMVTIPSIEGDINMRHLQDLLILNTCWFTQPIPQPQQSRHQSKDQGLAPFARYVILQLDQVTLSIDMGQAIGKVKLVPKQLSMQTHMIPGISQGIGLSLGGVDLTSEGRLTGELEIHRCMLQGHVDFRSTQQQPQQGSTTSSMVVMKKMPSCQLYISMYGIRGKFTYEYQNILDLVQEPIQLNATVNHDQQQQRQQLKVAIQAGRFIASVSIKTVPVIIVMHQRFMELLEKKRNEASSIDFPWHTQHSSSTGDNMTNKMERQSSQDPEMFSPIPISSSSSSMRPKQHYWPQSIVKLNVEGIQVIVYPSQFQDGDNVEIQAKQVEGSLEQTPIIKDEDQEGITRHLLLSIGKAALLKNVPGQKIMEKRRLQLDDIMMKQEQKEQQNNRDDMALFQSTVHAETDIHGSSGGNNKQPSEIQKQQQQQHQQQPSDISQQEHQQQQANKSVVVKEKGTFIFTLPLTKLHMDSTQVLQIVQHTFTVDFKDRVQVSLNIGQMKYLQELINMFNDQMARAKKTVDSTRMIPTTLSISATTDSEIMQQHDMDSTSLDSGIGVGGSDVGIQETNESIEQKDITKQDDKTNRLTYITDSAVHFDPQLRQMGDATPSVEWLLGFNRERLPGLIHENVTLHLDQVVHAIWEFYQNQLHKQQD
ncbi:uncharacterized protein BX664DRAFT_382871 [Halteromyces radiatus]|uniref:uncharacterized protein n=1 Tax=Halteromyces radiatus TaxID=101107 RepID=UPI00221F87C9|nr:uncharacterized protein BX664DRAFT_382871 [Halteromyces radiatus]KAI8096420.1 hypothetical protein BX664DRAFT_382871 [Halteromyces radiatus]